MAKFAEITRSIRGVADRVATRSVMNPLLWLCAIVAVPSFGASLYASEPYKFYFFLTGVLVALFAVLAYIYFMIIDPDRLQDEEFRLRDHALTIYGDSSFAPEGIERIIHGTPVTPMMIEQQVRSSDDE